jgi:hypothetical protein
VEGDELIQAGEHFSLDLNLFFGKAEGSQLSCERVQACGRRVAAGLLPRRPPRVQPTVSADRFPASQPSKPTHLCLVECPCRVRKLSSRANYFVFPA